MSEPRQPWEPNREKLGRWESMFDPTRRGETPSAPQVAPSAEVDSDTAAPALDLSEYRPWTLQRGRSRPAMLLDLRRYEPRSGYWSGWQMAYSHLVAVEYTGDRVISLDFGTRQFVIEGSGLDELARHLQQATVVAIQQYASELWPGHATGACIASIRKVEANAPRQ